jgi:hypothetical protein
MKQTAPQETTIGYEAAKFGDRKWGVILRLSERESIDQRVYRTTKRAAESDAAMLNRELQRLNETQEETA